jgi:cobalt-zinc-cadmium efflux system protein
MTAPSRQSEHHGHDHDHDHPEGNHHEPGFSEGHGHSHAHVGAGGRKGLLIALSITLFMMIAEIIGGILSNSLALLSDAGHMFTDTLALALSFFAMKFAGMPATEKKTFGFYRLEILAALLNGVILVLISLYIIYEAYHRILNPPPVQGMLMLVVAIIGLIVNIIGALSLVKHHESSLNIRSAFLHIIGDAVSSVGVIFGGMVIYYTGWYLIDPLLSILIALGIIVGSYGLMTESVNILLESAPSHINIAAVTEEIARVKGVQEAYHIHVWTITSGVYAMSAHVIVSDMPVSGSRALLDDIRQRLADRFKILHSTIQFECERCNESGVCPLPDEVRNKR